MAASEARGGSRSVAAKLELVTVYRDRQDISDRDLLVRLEERAEIYTIFNVIGVVRDVSVGGLGISFEGQQMMAGNLLEDGERYMLKLAMTLPVVPEEMRPFLRTEGNYRLLLLKVLCCWHQSGDKSSRAGFEVLDSNPAEVRAFVSHHFTGDPPLVEASSVPGK